MVYGNGKYKKSVKLLLKFVLYFAGLGDPSGHDSQNIAAMVEKLKELRFVNAFLLVLNSQYPRLDEPLRAMLNIFSDIFGKGFFSNVILVFTRWEYADKAEKKRLSEGTWSKNMFVLHLRWFRFDIVKLSNIMQISDSLTKHVIKFVFSTSEFMLR